MRFEPIAIVGGACVLPQALSPPALWDNVLAGKSAITRAPDRRWGLLREHALGGGEPAGDRACTDAGGYVEGFDAIFDPEGFAIPAETIRALDPLFQWVLHGVRETLRTIDCRDRSRRVGLVLGNLSFPSSLLSRFAEDVWLEQQGPGFVAGRARALAGLTRPSAHNRFMSGLPAQLAARALGLDGGAVALDAACASSLYALKLACDRLHDRRADVMVAGAVNGADSLFLHIGFSALSAMSPSGQSRPFHRDADGLLPAEGAGFVALVRLADAVAAKQRILGVIRGVGLSNDGRGRGLLAPSEEGQVRAMQLAYAESGLSPRDISLVECHATGTPLGDATELRSMKRVFAGARALPIGSIKSNLGHLITAAGMAGLFKVLGAMQSGRLPPSLHCDRPLAELDGSPFRLLRASEAWPGDRPRRAAVSAFGFGGNNAHLVVEAWQPETATASVSVPAPSREPVPIAVVGLAALVGDDRDTRDFTVMLFAREPASGVRATVPVTLAGLRFPPHDLERALPQQLLVLEAARQATAATMLPRERTAVLVGMGCDAEVARYGARWRLPGWADAWAAERNLPSSAALRLRSGQAWVRAAKDAMQPPLEAAGVLGRMPNVVANRLNSQLDLAGPSFTVSAEELSGVRALELATRALAAGEIDAAVVGAVDLSAEVVHQAALAALGVQRLAADGAVVLVVKRLDDARRDGDRVLALLEEGAAVGLRLGDADEAVDWLAPRGVAHAASGLLQVASAIVAVHHGVRGGAARTALPWLGARSAEVRVRGLEGAVATVAVRDAGPRAPLPLDPPPRLHVFSGADRHDVLRALAGGRESSAGPARLVLVATDGDRELQAAAAQRFLREGGPLPDGIAFRERPIAGELAFVFGGAAAAYPGMGRELALAFPELVDKLAARSECLQRATAWAYETTARAPHPLDQLWGASHLCQLHAELTRGILGLTPQAAIGYSSGESNALFALGAWRDLDEMVHETAASPLFHDELVGEFAALRRAWQKHGGDGNGTWQAFCVAAPIASVRAALDGERFVHLVAINAADDCVIGGESRACARVIERLGRERVLRLPYELAAHCPELDEIRAAWSQLHRRQTWDVPDVRFYSSGAARAYRATSDEAAAAITHQALHPLDFPRTIESAYADGVRVFVEHGPRGLCSGWIRRILGERDHVAVPLDLEARSSTAQLFNAVAWLIAAGVPVDHEALLARLAGARPPSPVAPALSVAAHRPTPNLPPLDGDVQPMVPAPSLPLVLPPELVPVPLIRTPAPIALPRSSPRPSPSLPPSLPSSALLSQVLARALAQQAELGAIHQAFVAEQNTIQQRYLALQQTMLTGLTRAARRPIRDVEPAPPSLPLPSPPRARTSGPVGRKLSREELEVHAAGRISSLFGPEFAIQDDYARQVRMPEPPLLLADRVTGIDAVAGSMGKGTIWTETDVRADSWYLHHGRMPAGITIESGQADLLLISWLGVDRLNRGERVYRLLGCELTFHGELPRPGDRLSFAITIDGHAQHGGVRLFFFHYDCHVGGRLLLSVRRGQAGFFTDEELRSSAGILWDPASDSSGARALDGPHDAPPALTSKRRFSRDEVSAFAGGRVHDCFGAGFAATLAHVRTPRIAAGKMLFLDEVTSFDPDGGPWRRGHLRAESAISPGDWFFAGHFKGDPCMPGTLMFEGCVQAMAFYLAALGVTLERDGWRFEPVPGQTWPMQCRGQVSPSAKRLVYEVFVRSFSAAPIPTLQADILCTVDGLKAFVTRGFGLRLVPDWPLEAWRLAPVAQAHRGHGAPLDQSRLGGQAGYVEPKPVARHGTFAFDHASLLACAWGRPTTAFGPFYERFDGLRRVARLPGPPYHFVSRILRVDAVMGELKSGAVVEAEYDVPPEVWYFDDNGTPTMPLCVLMEVALQPCGWLASYIGSTLTSETDFMFRNLDGTGTLDAEVRPGSGPIRTRARITNISQSAGMIIQSFVVECFVGDARIYHMTTVFGFFPPEAFANQVGLPVSADERARLEAPAAAIVELGPRPPRYFAGAPRLAGGMLCMIDRITACDPTGGKKGLGWIRGEKEVDPAEWFFKAHFFQDPVQPGSLGIEAFCQLLQFLMIERGMGEGIARARFEPLALGKPLTWKYRGQVVPRNRKITVELELVDVGEDERGRYALGDAGLWVDGKRIYHAKSLGMRIVAGEPDCKESPKETIEDTLDPAVDRWLLDHCPTWTLPSVPMMSLVDRLAAAARAHSGRDVVAISDVQMHRWLTLPDGGARLRTQLEGDGDRLTVRLDAWRQARVATLSRFEPVATGTVHLGHFAAPPPPWPLPDGGEIVADPYAAGVLFHGPAFQMLRALRLGPTWSSAILDAGAGTVPRGALGQGLLDAVTHAIPHDSLSRWCPDIAGDRVAYPYRLERLTLFGPLPSEGEVRVEVRFAGLDDERRFPRFAAQLITGDEVRAELLLVEILLAKGPIGLAPPLARRAFLRDRAHVPGLGLSHSDGEITRCNETELKQSDWLPGNVARIYAIPPEANVLEEVAIKDHVARRLLVHPSTILPATDHQSASATIRPLRRYPLVVTRTGDDVRISDGNPAFLDLLPLRDYWTRVFPIGPWPVEDLYYGLIERFIGDVVLADPAATARLRGRSVLYLANHQVAIESLLFSTIVSALSQISTITLAKAEHRDSWLGHLIAHCFSYPGVHDPGSITFFDRDDRLELLRVVQRLGAELAAGNKSVMIHIEGTRALSCRARVVKLSSAIVEMALSVGVPIVPVRFVGGLPIAELEQRLEFPVGFGKQDIWLGKPIAPAELSALPLKERKQVILDAINGLGPSCSDEEPAAPDPDFAAAVAEWQARTGASAEHAVLWKTLELAKQSSTESVRRLVAGARGGTILAGQDDKERWLAELAKRLYGPRGPTIT